MRELASLALDLGKRVEGHSAGATGRKLQAYFGFGISSCHEPITEAEVIERLRLGCWVMIREGAIRKELEGVKGVFDQRIDFRRLILTTDGMDPQGFLEEGYLDAALKRALRMGVPPGDRLPDGDAQCGRTFPHRSSRRVSFAREDGRSRHHSFS